MNIHRHYIIATAVMAIAGLASCSSADDEHEGTDGGGNQKVAVTFNLPIYVNTTSGTPTTYDLDGNVLTGTRADDELPGDPGESEECPPPAHLYIFASLKQVNDAGGNAQYSIVYRQINNLTYNFTTSLGDWQHGNYTPDLWGQNSHRYTLNNTIALSFGERNETAMSTLLTENPGAKTLGRVFVIGTPAGKRLTTATIKGWMPSVANIRNAIDNPGTSYDIGQNDYNAYVAAIQAATVDCGNSTGDATKANSAWTDDDGVTSATAWTPADYRDLYSTPYSEATVNGNTVNDNNGTFEVTGSSVTLNAIHLYHVAARYDFLWEVPEAVRTDEKTTFVRGITLTGIPTVAKVFNPTANDASTGVAITVANFVDTSDDNKFAKDYADKVFIGREYTYGFQPAPTSGTTTVRYTVGKQTTTITGDTPTYSKTSKAHESEFTPNEAFTHWLRVRATITEE